VRRLLVFGLIAFGLMFSSPALAHDPIILVSDQRTPVDGPLLPDGTVSFALYGTLEEPGDSRGFRVTFAEDDTLNVSLLVPDLEPENALSNDQLPRLEIVDPAGRVTTVVPTTRAAFAEPFTGTNYIRLADLVEPAVPGTYSVTISGDTPARFTVSVGVKELFGTAVENIENRDLGVGGVMTWYQTPPRTGRSQAVSTDSSDPAEPPIATDTVLAVARSANEPSTESDNGLAIPLVATAVGLSALIWLFARSRR
jgi:hypothetical protein